MIHDGSTACKQATRERALGSERVSASKWNHAGTAGNRGKPKDGICPRGRSPRRRSPVADAPREGLAPGRADVPDQRNARLGCVRCWFLGRLFERSICARFAPRMAARCAAAGVRSMTVRCSVRARMRAKAVLWRGREDGRRGEEEQQGGEAGHGRIQAPTPSGRPGQIGLGVQVRCPVREKAQRRVEARCRGMRIAA